MPTVTFTENLKRHLDCAPQNVPGETLSQALEAVFRDNPQLASYIVDDQGRVRKHILISIDNQLIKDRIHLSDPVLSESEIYVLQALSGG